MTEARGEAEVSGDLTQAGGSSLADDLIDEVVPGEVDWRAAVTGYPKLSVSLLALAGFWLGRSHGRKILSGISGLAADTVNDSINEFFGRELE